MQSTVLATRNDDNDADDDDADDDADNDDIPADHFSGWWKYFGLDQRKCERSAVYFAEREG